MRSGSGRIRQIARTVLFIFSHTWRQDSILLSLVRSLEKGISNIQIYTDHNMRAQKHPLATIPQAYRQHPPILACFFLICCFLFTFVIFTFLMETL